MTRKRFNILTNIGRARYVVNFHDGEKQHPDGSPFFDIAIFENKKAARRFVAGLRRDGYEEKQ